MGWVLNACLAFLLLFAVKYSAWAVAAAVAVYFALKLRRGGRLEKGEKRRRTKLFTADRLAGTALLVLALAALAVGGTLSVVLLSSLAVLAFFRSPVAGAALFSRISPVEGSVLVRRLAVPFMWLAVAEVKQSRGTLSGLLSGIQETIVVMSGGRAGAYVVIECFSLLRSRAESSVLERMRRLSGQLSPVGAYVLPLDSSQVCERFALCFRRERIEDGGWPPFAPLSDTVVIRPRGPFVEAAGAYTSVKDESSRPSLPRATQRMSAMPLLVEALDLLGSRVALPEPDAQTSFLASLCSAGGEPLGRVVEFVREGGGQDGTVAVRALSSPPAGFSRVQLRAMARVYACGKG